MSLYWTKEELTDPNKYWAAMLDVRAAADRAFRADNCAELRRLQTLIYETGHLGLDFEATYEQGLCEVTMLLALCLNNSGQFASVHNICQIVKDIRLNAERRREGTSLRSLGTVHTTETNVLADAKWQADAVYRDIVTPPEHLETDFRRLTTTVLPYAASLFGTTGERYLDCFERLSWAGESVAKCMYRYLPERLGDFIAFYNSIYGATLEAEAGAYCYNMLAASDPRAWDFEEAKLIMSGTATEDELAFVRHQRRSTYLQCVPPTESIISFDADPEFRRMRGLKLVGA